MVLFDFVWFDLLCFGLISLVCLFWFGLVVRQWSEPVWFTPSPDVVLNLYECREGSSVHQTSPSGHVAHLSLASEGLLDVRRRIIVTLDL